MRTVSLSEQEWGQLVAMLANNCVWSQVNPLLMKIGAQLEAQQRSATGGAPNRPSDTRPNSESAEADLDRRDRPS